MEVENIEFNNVQYEVKGLIEFSSLARLLFDLAKRHKELESKYEYINDSVQDKDQRLSDLELKINGEARSYKKKFEGEAISQKSKAFESNNKTITSNNEDKKIRGKNKKQESNEASTIHNISPACLVSWSTGTGQLPNNG